MPDEPTDKKDDDEKKTPDPPKADDTKSSDSDSDEAFTARVEAAVKAILAKEKPPTPSGGDRLNVEEEAKRLVQEASAKLVAEREAAEEAARKAKEKVKETAAEVAQKVEETPVKLRRSTKLMWGSK